LKSFIFLLILFFARPKKSIQKKNTGAPCAPLFPACPERGRGARLKIFFAQQRK
jgi:hypothetical protein